MLNFKLGQCRPGISNPFRHVHSVEFGSIVHDSTNLRKPRVLGAFDAFDFHAMVL